MNAVLAYLWFAVGEVIGLAMLATVLRRSRGLRRQGVVTMLMCVIGALLLGALAWRIDPHVRGGWRVLVSLLGAVGGAAGGAVASAVVRPERR